MVRIDDAGFGGIKVVQREGLGYGVDSVLLAGFASGETGARGLKAGSRIAELGSGNGIVSFIIAHKIVDTEIVGYEMRQDAVDRAAHACKMNNLCERVHFIKCDISDIISDDDIEKFDAVVTNPPYFKKGSAIPNSDYDKFSARHETTAEIGDFLGLASRMLEKGGDLYIVHRPDRLADIICCMREVGIEPKELQLVTPRRSEAANILLIHGVKGAGAELKLLPEIYVHGSNSEYSEMINSIYERRTQ